LPSFYRLWISGEYVQSDEISRRDKHHPFPGCLCCQMRIKSCRFSIGKQDDRQMKMALDWR
ncbi:MAG: hypothetical protein JSW37_12335, partial [Anaerolineales bacterium]